MDRLHAIAQLIVSCWRLADDERIPTSHGVLDLALQKSVANGAFPDWTREALHFSNSRIGVQCVELRSILDWAQRAELTDAPNPSYQSTAVKVSDWVARRLLRHLEVTEEQAKEWGETLRVAVEEAKHEAEAFEPLKA